MPSRNTDFVILIVVGVPICIMRTVRREMNESMKNSSVLLPIFMQNVQMRDLAGGGKEHELNQVVFSSKMTIIMCNKLNCVFRVMCTTCALMLT